ncbi:glycosyltransferase [Nostoc sp. PA-18-2419]|uniref:glycosyltransferase n=1 Tax=Nostoc sp. PA-18-2419 TaxID=2575443 RepID=UPI001108272B|nr:glycosyltransferase [Nostoc sp. PA-18-2419]
MVKLEYQNFYDENYYLQMVPGIPYDRTAHDGHWLRFFNAVADKLINYVSPSSVLDVGCAKGFLVEACYNRGVFVHGFDYSEYAISCVREDLKSCVFVASAADSNAFDKFKDSYDLVICIEVVEHMPRDEAFNAIKNMCKYGKVIFFSSTSEDFGEPTHLTVLPRINWLKIFIDHGFIPDYNFDIYDLIPHGILLRKIEDEVIEINKLLEFNELYFDNLNNELKNKNIIQSKIVNLESKVSSTQVELESSQHQLQAIQVELESSQHQLQATQVELKSSQHQLQATQVELESSQHQLQATQVELESSQHQLQATQVELENWRNLVSWMETSKFWKLRKIYLNLVQKIQNTNINLPLISIAIKSITIIRTEGYEVFNKRALNFLTYKMMGFRTKISFTDTLVAEVLQKLADSSEYTQWIKDYEPTNDELKQQKNQTLSLNYQPVISVILPVYKLPITILKETINSVLQQTYTNWELCIAFADISNLDTIEYLKDLSLQDKRIKIAILPENKGISGNSNVSLEIATGEFIALLDHDDLLTPWAFYEVAKKLCEQPDLDFIYSDKDCVCANSTTRSRLLLKPEWSPEILYSANYLTHLCIARRELVNSLGGFRPETDGAQDWDLFLRITEQTSRIARINSVLYHWRIIQGSTSLGIDSKPYALEAQLKCLKDHLSRTQLPAIISPHTECGFRLQWKTPPAKVSIVIDGEVPWSYLSACISAISVFTDSNLHKAKIVLPESNYYSQASEIKTLTKHINLPIDWLVFSEGNSKLATLAEAARQDTPDVVLFVSGQIARFQEGWIEELSGWVLNHPAIGFSSALILTNKNIVVEAGLIVDKHNNGFPLFYGRNLYTWETFGGALWYRNCSASSPWAVAFNYKHYLNVGGLPTDSPSVVHSTIKLCQASGAANKRGLVNPHARVFLADLPEYNLPKFNDSLANDPYFHPAFASVVPLKLKVKKGEL